MRYSSIHKLLFIGSLSLLMALFLLLSPQVARPSQAASLASGKAIVISISKQWLYAYNNGSLVYNTPATTGQPDLSTPTGTYSVFAKLSPTTFTSPWPQGSPYYYPPTYINYALEWKAGGFFIHDSWWRSVYGPGTNVSHYDPASGWLTGTHGCVTVPLKAAAWLYHWASIGTLVQVNP
jgi:lipoprotein-anchoring transpeptidase ErfK/SrfK